MLDIIVIKYCNFTQPYSPPPPADVVNVTKYAVNSDSRTSSNYQMSVSDCCWHWQDTVLAAGCQRMLSIYLLPIPRMPQFTCCKLFSLKLYHYFLSPSTVHCYTLRTSAFTKTPSPLSAFVRIGPYWPPPLCRRPLRMIPKILVKSL